MPAIIVPVAIRRDTAANWTASNPVLLAGQEGYETDTKKRKVGNGTSAWTALGYDSAGLLTTTDASATYVALSQKGAASGVASLGADSKVPAAQLPASAAVSDASPTVKGIVQLAGDLAGTATLPTVPGLATKATAAGLRYEFLWDGAAYVTPSGAAVGTRVAGTLRGFLGPADPNALGLMIDGDRWTDTAA